MKKVSGKWQGIVLALVVLISFGIFGEVRAASGANGAVRATAVQSDGKIIVGGDFTSYDGVIRNHIARLNIDGTLDYNFNPDLSAVDSVMAITIQADGKILIGGIINTIPSGNNRSIYRLDIDGNVDTGFAQGVYINGNVKTIAVQADGKILIGGYFSSYAGATRGSLARIYDDGTLDTEFNPATEVGGTIRDIAIQADGKIIIGGGFMLNNAPYWRNIARLNAKGEVDAGFAYGGIITWSNSVNAIAIQSDGKIIIGGDFRIYRSETGVFINNIARLRSDGVLDLDFSINAGSTAAWMGFVGANTTGYVNSILIRPDDKIVIVGSFGHLNILNADGKLNLDSGEWNGQIFSVAQSGKGIVVGGAFTAYNGASSNYVSLLSSNGVFVDPCSVLNLDASFDAYGFPIKENMVVITHGLGGSVQDAWVKEIKDNICEKIDRSKTTVVTYDWEAEADTTFLEVYDRAGAQGPVLTSKIVSLLHNNERQLSNVHFIAHSAGSNLIQTAVKSLDTYYDNNDIERPFVHLTFLDAYAPKHENEKYGELYDFTKGYAEQYVDMSIFPDWPDTNIKLPNAVNFDVTDVPGSDRSHEWPCKFYAMSVQYPALFNVGFPFSVESRNRVIYGDLPGKLCVVTDVSRPYNSCVDNELEKIIKVGGDAISALGEEAVSITTATIETSIDLGTVVVEGISKAATGTVELVEKSSNQILSQFTGLFSFHLVTGSPSWVKLNIAPKETISIMEFDRIFPNQDGEGVFTVYVDGAEVFAEYILPENTEKSSHKQILLSEKLPNGLHEVMFRIDSLSESQSEMYIADLRFGTQENIDTISPVTTVSESGASGINNWFRSDVQVSLSATDNDGGSGVDKTEYSLDGGEAWETYTVPFTISDEGTHEIKYRSIDLAGNVEADQSATIKIDKTAPVITGVAIPTANEKGWNKSDVRVDFVCEDMGANQSGVDINTITGNTLTTDGEGQSLTNAGECIDGAGNRATSVTVSGINIDKTAPAIILETPADGEKYVLHSTVIAKWSATDSLSGIDSFEGTVESGNQIDTSSVGPKDFSVTATDLAGNSVTKKIEYDVVYSFGGFQSPTTKDKSFNCNSTIPVKFQLTDASGKYISDAVASLKIDDKEAVSSGKSNEGDEFRYSLENNQYVFNLALKSMSLESGVHTLKIGLDDGISHEQIVTIK